MWWGEFAFAVDDVSDVVGVASEACAGGSFFNTSQFLVVNCCVAVGLVGLGD